MKNSKPTQKSLTPRKSYVCPSKYAIHTQSNQIIENNSGTVIGIQHSHFNDPEVQGAIVDLQILLTQLQSQYPQVTAESEALTVLDAEFTEIKQSRTHQLANLRKQLLNPERHLQAVKAAFVEVAKHYLEESLWSKTLLTYLDKLSEEPNHRA